MRRLCALVLLVLGLVGCGGSGGGGGVTFYALDNAGHLYTFSSQTPGSVIQIPLSGVTGLLHALSYCEPNTTLYGLADDGKLYAINTFTGVATLIGPSVPASLDSEMDYVPGTVYLRMVDTADDNGRIDATTGVFTSDTPLAFAAGDAHAGADPNLVAVAHDNLLNGAMYGIDSNLDAVVKFGSPESANNGVLHTVGPLGIDITGNAGFDVADDGSGYLAAQPTGSATSNLYQLDGHTGAATLILALNIPAPVISLTTRSR